MFLENFKSMKNFGTERKSSIKKYLVKILACFILDINKRHEFRSKYLSSVPIMDNSIQNLTKLRNNLLLKYIDLKQTKGLEFGPLHAPQVNNIKYNIKYADIQNREGIINYYKNDPNVIIEKIPDIDFVVSASSPSESIVEKFDYIIANHVIEHSPNPILYIQELSRLLNKNGILFMAIPDKKNTFDKNRPITTFDHLIDDYLSGADNSDITHVFEYNRFVVYENQPLNEVYKKTLLDLKKNKKFSHIHYHVFSINEFRSILNKILELKFFDMSLEYLDAPYDNVYEFYLIMRKN